MITTATEIRLMQQRGYVRGAQQFNAAYAPLIRAIKNRMLADFYHLQMRGALAWWGDVESS